MEARACCGSLAIVDNDKTVLWALGNALKMILPDCPVLWTAESGGTAIARTRVEGTCPDLLLLDMSLEGASGPAVCREIRRQGERPAILAMTSFPLSDYAQQVADAGAQGIIAKQGEFGELKRAIHRILDDRFGSYSDNSLGVVFQSARDACIRVRSHKTQGIESLTMRENDVIRLCVQGYSSEQIASRLGIAKATVDTLFRNACRRAGVANRVELAIQWYRFNGSR